jgi:hypothetical protein
MNSLSHSRDEPRPVPTLQDVSVWFPGHYDGRRTQFRTTCVCLSFSKEDEKEWMVGLGRYALIDNRKMQRLSNRKLINFLRSWISWTLSAGHLLVKFKTRWMRSRRTLGSSLWN